MASSMTKVGVLVLMTILGASEAQANEVHIEGSLGFALTWVTEEPARSRYNDPYADDAGAMASITATLRTSPSWRLGGVYDATRLTRVDVFHIGAVAGFVPAWPSRNNRVSIVFEAGVAHYQGIGGGENISNSYDIADVWGETEALMPYIGGRIGFEHDLLPSGRATVGLWTVIRGDLSDAEHDVSRVVCEDDSSDPCMREDTTIRVGGVHWGVLVFTLGMKI